MREGLDTLNNLPDNNSKCWIKGFFNVLKLSLN